MKGYQNGSPEKLKGKKVYLKILLIILIMMGFTTIVYADAGPKPSLTIYVINSDKHEYYLDLLVDKDSYLLNYEDIEGEYQQLKIFRYDDGEYKAGAVHSRIVHGDIKGKPHLLNSYKHKFSYRVPREFKVIYEDREGNVQVSNTIETNNFFASAVYDAKTNELQEMKAGFIYLHNFQITFGFIFRLVATILIELFIASFFKSMQNKKAIVMVNILTQIYLNVVFISLYYTALRNYPLTVFLVLEASIILIEYNIYKKYDDFCNPKSLMLYTIIANLVTMYLGYWMAF